MGNKLPKAIIKKYGITKKAWQVFRGQKGKSKSNRKTNKSKSRPISKAKRMGKNKNRRRRSFLSFSTITKFIKIGALASPGIASIMEHGLNQNGLTAALGRYTGFDLHSGQFNFGWLLQGWAPYVATSLITVGISKLNGIIKRL